MICRVREPVKGKKISFDDLAMADYMDTEKTTTNNTVPSFATLPRKKKLVSNPTTGAQSVPQVTWMKEVAQKGTYKQ